MDGHTVKDVDVDLWRAVDLLLGRVEAAHGGSNGHVGVGWAWTWGGTERGGGGHSRESTVARGESLDAFELLAAGIENGELVVGLSKVMIGLHLEFVRIGQ